MYCLFYFILFSTFSSFIYVIIFSSWFWKGRIELGLVQIQGIQVHHYHFHSVYVFSVLISHFGLCMRGLSFVHLSSLLTRLWQNISNFKSLMSSGIMACVYLHYHPPSSSSCLRRRVRENPQIPNVIELIDSLNSDEDATQQLHSLRTHLDVNEITFFKPNWKLRAAAGNSLKTLTFN